MTSLPNGFTGGARLRTARLLAALSLLVVPLDATAGWTELRSENFLFIGTAPEGTIRATAQKLEQFRGVMVRALPGATAASPAPTVVFVFDGDRSFAPYKPTFRGRAVDAAGFFLRNEDINYIAINAEVSEQAFKVVFHEYSHFLLGNWTSAAVPVWLGEGLAEVYATFQVRDGGRRAVLGAPDEVHLRLLRGTTLIPLSELIAIDQSSPIYNEGLRRGVLYAQSWALVHYLMYANKARAPQLTRFLNLIASGSSPGPAFRDAFGDVKVLDRELNEYLRNFTFPAIQMNVGERVHAGGTERGAAIPDAQASAYLGDVLARLGRVDDARAHLFGLVERHPDLARALCALGLMELRAGRFGDAMPLLERAATLAPDDPWVLTALGQALVSQFEDERPADGGELSLRRAREVLAHAADRDHTSAHTLASLGRAHLMPGGNLVRATSSLERALLLAPGREDYRLMLARALIGQGEHARATAELGPLLASGSQPGIRDSARELVGAIVDRGLRAVGPGETRIRGLFRSVDCRPDAVVLNIDQDGRIVRLSAAKLDSVRFVSYRKNAPSGVSCGLQPQALTVLATFRSADLPASGVDGYAVAIEIVEDDDMLR